VSVAVFSYVTLNAVLNARNFLTILYVLNIHDGHYFISATIISY
jgi:hypothetical protein